MSIGTFSYPMPANEPVLTYGPGTPERKRLKEVLAQLKKEQADIPMYIGDKEVRSNKKIAIHPPHELKHTLGYFHEKKIRFFVFGAADLDIFDVVRKSGANC